MESRIFAAKSGRHFGAARILVLLRAECAGNRYAFLFPLPFFLGLLVYTGVQRQSLPLDLGGVWVFTVAVLLLAMVYGLQCFSRETDRKTLDFSLSRPIPPSVLILVKYLTSLAILVGWFALFQTRVELDLAKLPLPTGMGWEWLLLALLSVHGMGFFAGIVSRGLERFMFVVIMSGSLGWLCHSLWQASFRLLTANYYWFDMPPVLYGFVCRGIPYLLALLSVTVPLAGVLWRLRGCPRPWRFPPLLGAAAAWAAAGLILLAAYRIFSPPLWPDRTAIAGDWRGNRVVMVAEGAASDREVLVVDKSSKRRENGRLRLATLWRGARTIYTGVNLAKPRFSPDGQWIAFAEDGRIKALRLRDGKILEVGPGHLAAWSRDSKRLIFAHRVGKRGVSRLYLAELGRGEPVPLTEETYDLADLAWDSEHERLYLVGFFRDLYCLDLRTMKTTKYAFDKSIEPSIYLGVITPTTVLDTENGLLYLGLINNYKLQVYTLDLKTGKTEAVEEKAERRMQTGAPLMLDPASDALIWPRIDGSFVYQSVFLRAVRHGDELHDHEDH